MKFIRNSRYRERAVEVLTKALIIGVSALFCLWMVSGARAAPVEITGIKADSGADGSLAINVSLSRPLPRDDVGVEFERNFIQVSLKGTSAYPARTDNINRNVVEKAFTYQYQPDLARLRVLLKTSAATVKEGASWEVNPAGFTLTLRNGISGAAPVAAATAVDSLKTKSAAANPTPSSDPEEQRMVKEILEQSKSDGKPMKTALSAAPAVGEDQPIFAAGAAGADKGETKGHETTATRIAASLLLVIGMIVATALGFKRFGMGRGMPFQKQTRVIEVVSSQSLGPKRSIALVKVLDQHMVIGMAGDGITLLANLGTDVKIDKFLDQAGPGASFSDAFDGAIEAGAAVAGSVSTFAQKAREEIGVRASIKKRIEGFKPL